MNNAMVATLVGLSMYAVAACEKAVDESARNGAQGPQVSFQAADANGDGRITSQEALAVPGLNFERMDSDRNQSVSPQEFATAMALSRPRG